MVCCSVCVSGESRARERERLVMGWDTEWPNEDNTRALCVALRDAFRGDWHYGTTGGNCSAIMCNGFSAGEPVVIYVASDAVAPVLGSDTLTHISLTNECGDWSDEWPVFESLDGNDERPLRLETVVDAVGRFIRLYGFAPLGDESDVFAGA